MEPLVKVAGEKDEAHRDGRLERLSQFVRGSVSPKDGDGTRDVAPVFRIVGIGEVGKVARLRQAPATALLEGEKANPPLEIPPFRHPSIVSQNRLPT